MFAETIAPAVAPAVEASGAARVVEPARVLLAVPAPRRGLGLTLYSNDGPRVALLEAAADLAAIRPQVVQIHGGPHALVHDLRSICARLQSMLPGVGLWVGVQWDGWISNYAAARTDRERAAVVAVYVEAARIAADCGVRAIIWNSEGKADANPAAARALEKAVVAQVRAACPALVQALTTFDHPTVWDEVKGDRPINTPGQAGFPWSAWIGNQGANGSPVDFWMPQTYASPGDGTMASKGALTRRLTTHRASTARAVSLGWISRDAREVLYFQGHHVPRVQTTFHGAREGFVFVWAAPKKTATVDGRLDSDGFEACRVLAEVARERPDVSGLDPAALAAWCQGVLSARGLLSGEGDGVFGAKSLAAARGLGWTGTAPDGALVELLRSNS